MVGSPFSLWIRQRLLIHLIRLSRPVLYRAAFLWRRILRRTRFVVVTGSLGKTTTKECLATILSSAGRTYRSRRNQNSGTLMFLNLLRVRPWHRFAVIELGVERPDTMDFGARVLRPDAAVVLNVLRTHTTTFENLDEYAVEKGRLLEWIAPGGTAVLNWDDARVKALGPKRRFRVVSFGTSCDADIRAVEVEARWPQRLRLKVRSEGEEFQVFTQLVGDHWSSAVLAALAVSKALGLDLRRAAEALRRTSPFDGRLQPMRLPSGAVVLRDDYSASIESVEAALKVMEEASAGRRIQVISDGSDFGWNRKRRLRYLAARAVRSADLVVFTGENAEYGLRRALEAGFPEDMAWAFPGLRETAEFLKGILGERDLVLIKGRSTDHVSRVYFAQLGEVGCWKTRCPKTILCDECWELGVSAKTMRRAVPEPQEPPPASER